MKFDKVATTNPIDKLTVVGRSTDRIDGRFKTTGRAAYTLDRHDIPAGQAYGYVVGASIAKGRIVKIDTARAMAAAGVLAVVTAQNAGKLEKGSMNKAHLLGGPEIEHYHQAVALVVAETFEQARAAAKLVDVDYAAAPGQFDLAAVKDSAILTPPAHGTPMATHIGDFEGAFAAAPVTVDATYTTPHHSHAMMEPHASIAFWRDDELTLWTSTQIVDWVRGDLAMTLGIAKEKIRLISPFVGGGFGAKLFLRSEALLAVLGAKAARRPVRVALPRAFIFNNTTHRSATIQRIRIGCTPDGKITAIGHESWSADLRDGGVVEPAAMHTRQFYGGANRMTAMWLASLDLPENNAMRAPGGAPGHMAFEIAMDEMAEKLGIDPIELRIRNDTQVDPEQPSLRFSQRRFVDCLRTGATKFGWSKRNPRPGRVRDGRWLVGIGMAGAIRDTPALPSAARVRLEPSGKIVVQTDMTDIGTGSYTIIAQTAAEMLGVPLSAVSVFLGDSAYPVSSGSGGQFGAVSSTSGVYAACVRLRESIAQKLGFKPDETVFEHGVVRWRGRRVTLSEATGGTALVGEDMMEYGDIARQFQRASFGSQFAEVGVDRATGEVRVRRMLAVCAVGRVLNPKSAHNQVIGGMTMGVGAALMEAMHVDQRAGYFVNHDLAGYEVPVHGDIPHQDVIFLDEADATISPMKARGVGELGICGAPAAVANAIYNATGIRVRDYPITLDKLLPHLPQDVA